MRVQRLVQVECHAKGQTAFGAEGKSGALSAWPGVSESRSSTWHWCAQSTLFCWGGKHSGCFNAPERTRKDFLLFLRSLQSEGVLVYVKTASSWGKFSWKWRWTFHPGLMLTTFKPPRPEGTRGNLSLCWPCRSASSGQLGRGRLAWERSGGRVAGCLHSRALTLLYGGQNLFWSLERVQVGSAVRLLRCMTDGLFIR